jgi:type I restriction enzyme S subunit
VKKSWEKKTLGEVLERTETVNPPKSPNTEFDYIDVSSVSNTTFEIEATQRLKGKNAPSRARKLVRTNDIIFATIRPTLQRIAIVPEHLDQQVCSTGYFVLRPKPALDHRFVFYSLFTEDFTAKMQDLQKGASYPAVTDGDVRAQEIPIPPLPEQQRIVGVLDETFEGLATAKASAEKNLQNARALFESHLQSVFTQRGKGWAETPFEDCIEDVKYTQKIQRKDFLVEGKFPIVSQEAEFINGHWDKASDVFKVTTPVVIFGDHTKVLKYVDFDFVLGADGVKILQPRSFLNPKFLFYALRSVPLKTLGYARHYRLLKEVKVSYPDKNTQAALAQSLDLLAAETERLARIYEQKLTALETLKKSLLHQAFAGEL